MSSPRLEVSPGVTPTSAGPPTSLWSLVRLAPRFRALFLSRAASMLGDWFNLLALLSLLEKLGYRDATSTGGVVILKFLPVAVAGPLAGVIADRFPRRLVMIVCDSVRFVLVSAMFAAPYLERGAAAYLLTLTFLQSFFGAIGEPARAASIPNTVPAAWLGAANTLSVLAWSATYTFGAAAGGLATRYLGWQVALGLDALSYLVSIALVRPLQLPPPPHHARRLDAWALVGGPDMLHAIRSLLRRRSVLRLFWIKTGWGLGGAMTVLLTLFGARVFAPHGEAELAVAALYVARGLGMGIGPLLLHRFTALGTRRLATAIALGFLVFGAAYAGLGQIHALNWAIAVVFVGSIGESALWVYSTLLVQRAAPDRLRGRWLALDIGACTITSCVVTHLYGRALDANLIALSNLTALLGSALIAAGLVWIVLARTSIRRDVPL
ncbi:MAG: MFS transporter [Acidobacteriota bacterium]